VPALPVIDLLAEPFYLFGMFHSYEPDARELIVRGFDARTGVLRTLDAAEFFPGSVPDRQIWAQGQRELGELILDEEQRREQLRLLRRIRERHNRLHPDHRVTRVQVGHLSWPRSPQGHEAERARGAETFELWYGE
jgi:hypothetical protein